MLESGFKIAFIGSHGVGKTTLCYGLAARLKAADVSLEVVGEIARRCPLPINRGTTLAAQAWILHTQIAEELVATSRYDFVICDRSVLDNFVYLLLAAGGRSDLEPLITAWTATYQLLVHVPVLEGAARRRHPFDRSVLPAGGRTNGSTRRSAQRGLGVPAARRPAARGLARPGRKPRSRNACDRSSSS